MPIPFTCPHCGHQTSVDERYAGQTGPCASCGETITVPPAADAPPERSSPWAMFAIIVVVLLAGFLLCGGMAAALLFPAVRTAKERTQRAECPNNLKQIGLAMHNYHDTFGCLPTAVITDENDQPMRSWRVAILPFVEQRPLYNQYDSSEPWDGPNNQALRGTSIPTYRCPDDVGATPSETSYVMIVGKGTIGGEPNEGVKFAHVTDGTSNTIMAIEVGMSGIHWMEPHDLTVDEAVTLLTDPASSEFQQVHPGGAHVLFGDGRVDFLPESTDPAVVRSLLIRDGGQAVRPNF